jgi:hypothetical protein
VREPTRGVSQRAGIDGGLQRNDLRVKLKQGQPDTAARRWSVELTTISRLRFRESPSAECVFKTQPMLAKDRPRQRVA